MAIAEGLSTCHVAAVTDSRVFEKSEDHEPLLTGTMCQRSGFGVVKRDKGYSQSGGIWEGFPLKTTMR